MLYQPIQTLILPRNRFLKWNGEESRKQRQHNNKIEDKYFVNDYHDIVVSDHDNICKNNFILKKTALIKPEYSKT